METQLGFHPRRFLRSLSPSSRKLLWAGIGLLVVAVGLKVARVRLGWDANLPGPGPRTRGGGAFHGLFQEFTAAALLGSVLIFWLGRPAWRDVLWASLLGLSLTLLHLLTRSTADAGSLLLALAAGQGLGAISMLGMRGMALTETAGPLAGRAFLAAALMPACFATFPQLLDLTTLLHPHTYDLPCWVFENALGTPPVVWLGRWMQSHPAVGWISQAVYNAIPVVGAGVCALQIRGGGRLDFALTYLILTAVGLGLYHLMPVVGPVFLLSQASAVPVTLNQGYVLSAHFQTHPPALEALLARGFIPPPVWRNCMPSLHTAWALLVLWHARTLGRAVAWAGWATLLFTVLATVGFALHYTLDLVVAVPVTLAVHAACAPAGSNARRTALILGVALAAGWSTLALTLPPGLVLAVTPALWWGLILATVWVCFRWSRKVGA